MVVVDMTNEKSIVDMITEKITSKQQEKTRREAEEEVKTAHDLDIYRKKLKTIWDKLQDLVDGKVTISYYLGVEYDSYTGIYDSIPYLVEKQCALKLKYNKKSDSDNIEIKFIRWFTRGSIEIRQERDWLKIYFLAKNVNTHIPRQIVCETSEEAVDFIAEALAELNFRK